MLSFSGKRCSFYCKLILVSADVSEAVKRATLENKSDVMSGLKAPITDADAVTVTVPVADTF